MPPPIPYADADTNEMTLNDIIRSLRYRKMLFDTGDTVRPNGASDPPDIPKIQKDPSSGFEGLGNSFSEHLNTPPANVGPGGGFAGLGNSFREHLTPPAGGTGDRGILDWANDNKWPLMGGAAAAALLGGGAYAYHRNRKKKKNAYGEEEKEAQYKPYTSYTPPIISPYHMIKKSDTPLGQPEKTLKDDPFMGGFFSYPVAPMPRVKNLNDNIEGLPSKEDPYNPPGLPTPPPGGGIAFSEAEGAVPKPSQIDRLAYNLAKMVGTGSGAGQGVSASPAAPEDPGAIDEDFLAQEGGPNYLKTQDPPTPATPAAPPTPVKTQDPSWFEQISGLFSVD